MKIAFVSPYSLEVFGGVQGQVMGLANALADTDEVEIIAPGAAQLRGKVHVHGVGPVTSVPANGSRAPIALGVRQWRATGELLRRFRPDVVHVHEPFVPVVGLAALRSGLAPIVATFHRGGAGRFYPLLAPVLRRDFQRISQVVAVSKEAAITLDAVFGQGARAISILPNAIDVDRFERASVLPSSRPVIVFVGRLEARKGLTVLLEAFGDGISDARVEVIGDGPERERLERHFGRPGAVEFLGALDDLEMASHLASAEIFVAPALSGESFGVVLLEAMAARTAVIASSIPGYRLAGADAAMFVPPGDVEALRAAIIGLLASPDRRQVLLAAGRARAEAHSFSFLAGAYREIYESTLGK